MERFATTEVPRVCPREIHLNTLAHFYSRRARELKRAILWPGCGEGENKKKKKEKKTSSSEKNHSQRLWNINKVTTVVLFSTFWLDVRPPISSVGGEGFSRENFFVFDSPPREGKEEGMLRSPCWNHRSIDVGNFVWIKLNISWECSSYDGIVADFFSWRCFNIFNPFIENK